MNYNMLTNKEILRIAEPETDLEKRLLTLAQDVEDNEGEMNLQLSEEVGNLEDTVRDLEEQVSSQDDEIAVLENNIEELKSLLDDNNIDYSETGA